MKSVAIALILIFSAACLTKFVINRQIRFQEAVLSSKVHGWLNITFTGQGKTVLVNDQQSVSYLEDCFAHPEPIENRVIGTLGYTYDAVIRLRNGDTAPVRFYVDGLEEIEASTTEGCDFTDPVFFAAKLRQPMPTVLVRQLLILSKAKGMIRGRS